MTDVATNESLCLKVVKNKRSQRKGKCIKLGGCANVVEVGHYLPGIP